MIILALDTCLGACSAAVLDGERVLAAASEAMERGQQERLGPLVLEVVERAGVGWCAVERVAVTVGPGSFTGLRVGLAFAKGVGLARGVPVVGVGTLAAIAASVDAEARRSAPSTTSRSFVADGMPPFSSPPVNGGGTILAAVDARRGQVWMQAFEDDEALGPAEAPDVAEAGARAAALVGGGPVTVVGSAAELVAGALPGATVLALAAPDPVAVARLGAEADPAKAPPVPIYLRAPDAKLPGGRTPEAA